MSGAVYLQKKRTIGNKVPNDVTAENQRRIEIVLAGLESLLGMITPNLRAVQVAWTNNCLHLYFIYDGEVTDEGIQDCQTVRAKIQQNFPSELVSVNFQTIEHTQKLPVPSFTNYEWLFVRKV